MQTEELAAAELADHQMLVALTPAELPAAQNSLLAWCDSKIAALDAEVKDLEEHRAIAKSNGWKLSAVERQLSLSKRRITYYGKIRAAVDAGYLIIPNMPVDVFAVRVNRDAQPSEVVGTNSWRPRLPAADPQVLPEGEGRYVGGALALRHGTKQVPHENGKMETKHEWISGEYIDVDFPMKAVKPVVLDATARALGLRIFDQLGIVRDNGVQQQWGRKGDPIVVGQLIDPRRQGRGVTFFVAWWLNTADL